MITYKHFCVIGGDNRQTYLVKELINHGHLTSSFYVHNIPNSTLLADSIQPNSTIILPIPFSKDNRLIYSCNPEYKLSVKQLLSILNTKNTIYGGCFSQEFRELCTQKEISCIDIMDNQTFAVKNTIATSEGTIAEAISNSPINLDSSKCLILGYGKCAKAIAKRLEALSAHVCICVKDPTQQLQAFNQGFLSIDFTKLISEISRFDFIFNTVPALVLTSDILAKTKFDATIIDIASYPGGTDFASCKAFHLNAKLCLGLPGKYSPKTSAQIIYQIITEQLPIQNNSFTSM